MYQAVTDRILEMLDRGTVPWRYPIRTKAGGDWPRNLESGRTYRGVNVFLLAVTAWMHGYGSPFWLTFRQALLRGGHVRKGEKSSLVVFWKQHDATDEETGEPMKVPVLRHYNVFNAEQCEGVDPPGGAPEPAAAFEPIEAAQRVMTGYADGPVIEHAGGRAYYRPSSDTVWLPEPARFLSREFYYATAFHELAHSTGHKKRLDRGLSSDLAPFGSPDYSREELVAEMASAFLCATAGIGPPTIEQSAAYIEGWKKRLSGDRKLVITAAGAGQRAADWILGNSLPSADRE
ncbi:MAG: ArdC family protein [Phycisphaerales bacterium]